MVDLQEVVKFELSDTMDDWLAKDVLLNKHKLYLARLVHVLQYLHKVVVKLVGNEFNPKSQTSELLLQSLKNASE